MEGMIAKDMVVIQEKYIRTYRIQSNPSKWAQQLIIKLLECTHSLWLYRNIMVHDKWAGEGANERKETILQQIEEQLDSEEELLEEHQYLLEINLGDIATGTGERHEYWLLAVQAAREAKRLASLRAKEGIG